MSAHMRKHPTKGHHATHDSAIASVLYVMDNDVTYAIPEKVARKYIIDVKKASHSKESIAASDLFAEMDKKNTKAGALLRGVRARENLGQIEFAERIEVSQTNLSKMENGKRPIGKIVAKRIAREFDVNYRYFL